MSQCKNCKNEILDINESVSILSNSNGKKTLVTYCRECYNLKSQNDKYKKELEKYLKEKFEAKILNSNIHRQLKIMHDSGLNNKQIYFILWYTYSKKSKTINKNYTYTIQFAMNNTDEALKFAEEQNIDLISIDEDYFSVGKENEKELLKDLDKRARNRMIPNAEKQKLKKLEEKRKKQENKEKQLKIKAEKKEYENAIATKFSEKQLEDYLVEHLDLIEDGLTYIARQYEVPHGYLDILAKDKNNKLCIIELKVDDDDKRLIYQVAYYPTQFKEETRMITVAPSYSKRILDGLKNLTYVERYSYIPEYGTNKNPIKSLKIVCNNTQNN